MRSALAAAAAPEPSPLASATAIEARLRLVARALHKNFNSLTGDVEAVVTVWGDKIAPDTLTRLDDRTKAIRALQDELSSLRLELLRAQQQEVARG